MAELDDADEATMIGMLSQGFNSATDQEGDLRSCVTSTAMISGSNICSSLQEFLNLANAYIHP
jgi:hypothetical protein